MDGLRKCLYVNSLENVAHTVKYVLEEVSKYKTRNLIPSSFLIDRARRSHETEVHCDITAKYD